MCDAFPCRLLFDEVWVIGTETPRQPGRQAGRLVIHPAKWAEWGGSCYNGEQLNAYARSMHEVCVERLLSFISWQRGERVCAHIREMPGGLVDSINPGCMTLFLIPHPLTLINSPKQYEWQKTTWVQAFVIHAQMRLNWSHYFPVRYPQSGKKRGAAANAEIRASKWCCWYPGFKNANIAVFSCFFLMKIVFFTCFLWQFAEESSSQNCICEYSCYLN